MTALFLLLLASSIPTTTSISKGLAHLAIKTSPGASASPGGQVASIVLGVDCIGKGCILSRSTLSAQERKAEEEEGEEARKYLLGGTVGDALAALDTAHKAKLRSTATITAIEVVAGAALAALVSGLAVYAILLWRNSSRKRGGNVHIHIGRGIHP